MTSGTDRQASRERELLAELEAVAGRVVEVGAEHRKCLACHCYRDVAEETVEAIETLCGRAGLLVDDPSPDLGPLEALAAASRDLLTASEGAHG